MNLRQWAEDHGEVDRDVFRPWVCVDPDQWAVEGARQVVRAWDKWERTVGEDDPALPEWLALLTALDRAEADIEAAAVECQCYECDEGRRRTAAYRVEARNTAGEFGLPCPPTTGRIPRYPVNVDAVRDKGRRLAESGKVWHLDRDIYIVVGDTGAYYVRTRNRPDVLEWECCCPWGQPQGKGKRPGAGCSHVHALQTVLAGVAVVYVQRVA